MKTAILGGSYNPVHHGHLLLAHEVLQLGYEKILFIPVSSPPHKSLSKGASDEDRLSMLSQALSDFPWADIWDGEIRRQGYSYTIDTLRILRKMELFEGLPGLILGDDLADDFYSWREASALAKESELILAKRQEKGRTDFPYPCQKLNNILWPYSSSKIRQYIKEGKSIDLFVPPCVAQYIQENKLYAKMGK